MKLICILSRCIRRQLTGTAPPYSGTRTSQLWLTSSGEREAARRDRRRKIGSAPQSGCDRTSKRIIRTLAAVGQSATLSADLLTAVERDRTVRSENTCERGEEQLRQVSRQRKFPMREPAK